MQRGESVGLDGASGCFHPVALRTDNDAGAVCGAEASLASRSEHEAHDAVKEAVDCTSIPLS